MFLKELKFLCLSDYTKPAYLLQKKDICFNQGYSDRGSYQEL